VLGILGVDSGILASLAATEVAALHPVVGLAAVLTSIGSVISTAADHHSTLHLVTAYLGVLIDGVTFTGSIVAFLKLAGKMSSRPLTLRAGISSTPPYL